MVLSTGRRPDQRRCVSSADLPPCHRLRSRDSRERTPPRRVLRSLIHSVPFLSNGHHGGRLAATRGLPFAHSPAVLHTCRQVGWSAPNDRSLPASAAAPEQKEGRIVT